MGIMDYANSALCNVITVAFVSLLVCFASSHGAAIPCSRPSNSTLQQLHSKLTAQRGALLPDGIDMNSISSDFVTRQHLYGDTRCPASAASGRDDPVEARSICPWYYVINHDPTRYPTTFAEAECRCTKCIDNNTNRCEAVTYSVPILRQTAECQDGFYVYEPEWMEIKVGCTCALPRTSVGEPIEEDGGPEISK